MSEFEMPHIIISAKNMQQKAGNKENQKKNISYKNRSVININELIANEKTQAEVMFEHMKFILEQGNKILEEKKKGYIDTNRITHLAVATNLMEDFLEALQDTISGNKKKFL